MSSATKAEPMPTHPAEHLTLPVLEDGAEDLADPELESSFGTGLCLLAAVLGVLVVVHRHRQATLQQNSGAALPTREFRLFQSSFVRVYLTALATEWLQVAYIYMLLDAHGYGPERIARVFLAGVVGQLGLTLLLELAGGFMPMKARCLACLALQGCSCALLLHSAFGGLVVSRALGGLSTALLQSAFEGWMVQQHASQGFPSEWLLQTFDSLLLGMSALAVASGPLGEAALAIGGVTGPFKLAIVLVAVNALLVGVGWRRDRPKGCPGCADTGRQVSAAMAVMGSDRRVGLLAAQQACFEAAMFIFALEWTPLLARPGDISRPSLHPPYALILAQFMVCLLIGSWGYKLVVRIEPGATGPLTPAALCCTACSIGGCCCALLAALPPASLPALAACLAFEGCAGVYLSAAGYMRAVIVPQEGRGLCVGAAKLAVAGAAFGALVPLAGNPFAVMLAAAVLALAAARLAKRVAALGAAEALLGGAGSGMMQDTDR